MTAKKQRCRKPDVFPCKTRCVRRYHPQSKKEQHCRNVAEGTPSTYLEWVKQQGQRKKKINTDRKKAGLPFLKSDAAGYLINPDKNKKGKLPASYKGLAEEARRRAETAPTPELKSKLESVAQRFDKLEESAQERGGDLAPVPKPSKEIDQQKQRQAKIDAKYSSAQPSDDDIVNWRNETIENWGKPTPANIERLTAQQMLSYEGFIRTPEVSEIIASAYDKDSFVKAYTQLQDILEKATPPYYSDTLKRNTTRQDYEYWLEFIKENTKESKHRQSYQQATEVLNNPRKSAKSKSEAQKVVDSVHDTAQKLWKLHVNQSKDGYVPHAQGIYNRDFESRKQDVETALKTYFDDPTNEDVEWEMEDYILRSTGLRHTGDGRLPDDIIRSHLTVGNPFKGVQNKADLKRRFRKFAMENHPDKGGDPAKFRSIVEQYESILKTMR